jgi:hypothetical protein
MHRHRSTPTLALFALLALGASACAGGGGSGSRVASLNGSSSGGRGGATTTTAPDPQDAALAFARCMRQHGIDMPDPQPDSSGRTRLQARGPDKRKLQAAEGACGSLLKGGNGPGQPLSAAQQDALLNFARCMRQHGIDIPDPTPGQAGVTIRKQTKDQLDSPKFKRAEAACMHFIDQAFKPNRGGSK